MINIVLHIILFQTFEYQGLIIYPSERLSNLGYMTSCAKLVAYRTQNLRLQFRYQRRMYTPIYPLFCVLSTTTTASEN